MVDTWAATIHNSSDAPIVSHPLPYLPTQSFCYHCGNSSTGASPLKRCRGCGIALYCGRDCQKAAWPMHRTFCRSSSTANTRWHEELGYVTPLSLINAVKEWAEIHCYTLKTITQIALYTNGGVDHNLTTPHTMVFILDAISNDFEDSGHPSKAFRLFHAKISHKDRYPSLSAHWEEEQVVERERVLADWRGGFIQNPTLAGAFPTTFIVRDSSTISYHCYDVYHPLRHPTNASPDELTRLAFADLDLLCT
ncbi:hypothetical protein LXA43DRAFT_1051156, partial [Ganoderma leucocontextum]